MCVNRLLGTALRWLTAICLFHSPGSLVAAQWGGVDPTFTPGGGTNKGFDADVLAVDLQSDGYILPGGAFTVNGRTSRSGIARISSTGSLDIGFDPGTGANGTVQAVLQQPDGKVLIGGRFTTVNNVAHAAIARLNSNGSLDGTFTASFVDPAISGSENIISSLALQADGKILIGGTFNLVNGPAPGSVARLNTNGTVDSGFDPPAVADNIHFTPSVQTLALQADGRVLIGGQFTDIGAASRNGIARLDASGSLDPTFDPGPGTGPGTADRGRYRVVYSIALQPDGKVLAGGDFTNMVGTTSYHIARLGSNGSLDSTFASPLALASGLLSVKVEVDGKILIGGDIKRFDLANPNDMARLMANGSYDTNFSVGTGPLTTSGAPPLVRAIAIQPDGRLIVVGTFNSFNGVTVNYVTRLLGDQGGTVEFAAANFSADENAGNATIALRRTGSTAGSISVNYATGGGTATPGADYTAQTGAVLFGPGETNKTFTIPVLPDSLVEGNETVGLTLANPIGGVILGNQKTATLTIIDNTNAVVNSAPVLAAISDKTASEGNPLTFTATATDPDGDSLTFSLDPGAPAGAVIDGASGVFAWTPTEAQGPGSYSITVRVTDDGSPQMSDNKTFTVVINEVNSPPAIAPIGDKTAIPGAQLTFTVSASDADVPLNSLTFTLDPGAPPGAAIDPSSGVFTWTPPANQASGTNAVTVRVTDNGVPSQTTTRSFNILVPARPVIQAINDSGGSVTLTWSAASGLNYRVQFKPNLAATTWSDLPGDVTAADSTATKIDSTISGNERYYRIELLP